MAGFFRGNNLKRDHRIREPSEEEPDPKKPKFEYKPIVEGLSKMRRRAEAQTTLFFKDEADEFRHLYLNWVLDSNQSFEEARRPSFRALMRFMNPVKTRAFLPRSPTTIRQWLEERYLAEQEALRREIESSSHPIHLSFDLWTSPNTIAMLAVVAHFADSEYRYQTRTLAVSRFLGAHSGQNIAHYLLKVIDSYNLRNRIGYFQSDNAFNNDTCVRALLTQINPAVNADWRRVRCICHIVSLVAKTLINGPSSFLMNLKKNTEFSLSEEEENRLVEEWGRLGPVGKLYNLVHWIRKTPQRRDAFKAITRGDATLEEIEQFGRISFDKDLCGLQLQADNDTRWNSTFYMIERAIRLRNHVDYFCLLPRNQVPAQYHLNAADWGVLCAVQQILKPLEETTKYFEGREPNFFDVIATIYELIEQFENHMNTTFAAPREATLEDSAPLMVTTSGRPRRNVGLPQRFEDSVVELPVPRRVGPGEEFDVVADFEPLPDSSHQFIRNSLSLALGKLTEYRQILEASPVYWSAMILHPAFNSQWVTRRLPPEQYSAVITAMRELYNEEYSHREIPSSQGQNFDITNPQLRHQLRRAGHNHFSQPGSDTDEIAGYFFEPVNPVENPIQWWQERKHRYPRLHQMAIDLLTIPASSTECERIFSLGRLILGLQRHSLTDSSIEKLLFLKKSLQMEVFEAILERGVDDGDIEIVGPGAE